MADLKTTALPEATTLADTDILYAVDNVATSATSKKITVANAKTVMKTGLVASDVVIPNGVGSPSFNDVQDFLQETRSAGRITGGVVSAHAGPNGTVDISEMEGMIFTTNALGGNYIFFKQAAATTGLALTDLSVNWIYFDWNGGTPRYLATTDRSTIHEYDQFTVGRVWRSGNNVEVQPTGHSIYDKDRRVHNRLILKYGNMDRASGAVISQHATALRIQSDIGNWYVANTPFITNPKDKFYTWYKTGGGAWTKSAELTLFSDVFDSGTSTLFTSFQNGTSIGTLTNNNHYGVYWMYMCPDGDLYCVMGSSSYSNIGNAQAATIPASLPPYCVNYAKIVGKVICKKSAAALYSVESAFAIAFSGSSSVDHASTTNLGWTSSGHTGTAAVVAGFGAGGVASEFAIDTDLSSVSANDDTVPSAKATKSYADGKVEDNITDGHTTIAPSGNSVYDALALKSTIASPTFTTQIITPVIAGSASTTNSLTIRANTEDLTTGQVNITSSLEASSTTAAALTTAGGLGVAKRLWTTDLTSTNLPTLGGTALTTTVAKLNYLTSITGFSGTTSGKVAGDTAPTFVTSITTPSVLATANDSGALGASGTAFSDLFLASGGVINWVAGNATLTHSTGLLTSNVPLSLGTSNALTCGSIELGAAADTTITRSGAGAIQVEGVQVLLSGAALGTPASGTLTSCTGLPIAGLVASTSTAIGVGSIELGHASDCTIARVGAGQISVEAVVVPTISSTNTLTNKRITKRVVTTTDDSTAVIDVDVTDVYELSAVANATTISTTGTPTDGQQIMIRLKDAGGAKGLTWDGVFVAIGVTLPTTTVAGKWHYIGVQYNTAGGKWHAIAVGVQA